jgi:hypothetical protein
VVEVRQHGGAWRLLCRVTDALGAPLPGVSARPDPWGPCPNPPRVRPRRPTPWSISIRSSRVAESKDPPDAVGLRALADYAQAAALPDADRLLPRVAVESAWESDPGPRSLRAWLDLLPEAEQGPVRTTHRAARPLRFEDVYADLALRLDEAWAHFHGRRFVASREVLDTLRREAPDFWPALKLEATVLEELDSRTRPWRCWNVPAPRWVPRRPEAPTAMPCAPPDARDALFAALASEVARGDATADELYQCATGLRARGEPDRGAGDCSTGMKVPPARSCGVTSSRAWTSNSSRAAGRPPSPGSTPCSRSPRTSPVSCCAGRGTWRISGTRPPP